MMQLLCNGEAVDLARDTNIQFTDQNPLFSFDSLSCERTTEFSLPATPTNDRIFSLARRPDFNGKAMRVIFDAQVHIDAVSKTGYLYVSQWTGSEYKAVFVCGEYITLQRIKDLGNIPDIVDLPETVRAGENVVPAGEPTAGVLFANIIYEYRQPTGDYEKEHPAYCRPSIGVEPLLQRICQQNNIPTPTIPEAARLLRIIPPYAYLPHGDFAMQCQLGTVYAPVPNPPRVINTLPQFPSSLFTTEAADYSVIWQDDITQITQSTYYRVLQFKCLVDMDIKIPREFPETAYMYDMSGWRSQSVSDEWGNFYGERMFEKRENDDTIYRSGFSLAGRTITMQAGDVFSFVDERMYVNTLVGNIQTKGFIMHTNTYFNTLYNLSVSSQNGGDAARGQIVRAQDCLPDVTVISLLKAIAATSGTMLMTNGGLIQFNSLDLNTFSSINITSKVISRGSVSRGFMNYGQNNYIEFESGESVKDRERLNYAVKNVNLKGKNILQTLPFSEGDDAGFLGLIRPFLFEEPANGVLYVTGFDDGYILANNGQYYVEADPEDPESEPYWEWHQALTRATLPKNTNLQRLCDRSTKVEVTARMSAFEYDRLHAATCVILDGMRYVWVSKQWQDGVVRLTLAQG